MMIDKKRRKRESGQGLVEFALVLPVLLLTLMGIADFGRLFAVYSNLLNAAREGARYGVVSPMDVDGITMSVRNTVSTVNPEDVDIAITFDGGPGTSQKNFDQVAIGDRVIVQLNGDVEMMTPFIRAIARQLHIETSAARTISTLGVVGTGGVSPSPPTDTPDGTTTPSPTPTPLSFDTPTPTLTSTPGPTLTPTPPAGIVPIQITTPLWDGDMVVTGVAQAGELVHLRDIQNPALDLSTTVSGDGTFQFDLPLPLVAGHVISVQGYGSIDYALVEGAVSPTPSPTPTATSAPTPTPSTQYIDIDPTCGPGGVINITVSGHLWPTNKKDLFFLWDGVKVLQMAASSDFEETINVNASAGSHTVRVETEQQGFKYYDSKTFVVPCAGTATPTPTPSQPNLVVESISLGSSGVISTYQPLTFTVAVRNIGAAAVNSLFWVDLYMDPAVQPPAPGDLMGQASEAWVAVSSLSQDEVIYLTLSYLQGLTTLDEHNAYALADTWDQVLESDESDNVGGPVPVLVSQQGVPPTATPAPTPGGDSGAISGSTWLFINGDVVPQGRINVYCYDGDVLVAETLSDQTGNYLLEGLPAGACTVSGQTVISGALYQDYVLNVQVNAGQTTTHVTLVLH